MLPQPTYPRKLTEVAVLSGKGGTGKTSLCAAFATMCQNMVVADCDVDAANLHLILQPENYVEEPFTSGHKAVIDYERCTTCGLCVESCRFEAISLINYKVEIDEIACDGCKLCSRICREQAITMVPSNNSRWYIGNYRNGKLIHARLAPGEENSGRLVSVVREEARKIAAETGCNTLIIDGPPGTGCPAIASLTGAHRLVVVTEPSRSGFHDLKRILELASNFCIKPCVVINKYDLNIEMTQRIQEWCRKEGIELAGNIAFSEKIVEAMVNCKSIMEWDPDSETGKAVRSIFGIVFGITALLSSRCTLQTI